ncbi:hypothetical protein SRHO_G00323540 [Serrasalmus rhombeus]
MYCLPSQNAKDSTRCMTADTCVLRDTSHGITLSCWDSNCEGLETEKRDHEETEEEGKSTCKVSLGKDADTQWCDATAWNTVMVLESDVWKGHRVLFNNGGMERVHLDQSQQNAVHHHHRHHGDFQRLPSTLC